MKNLLIGAALGAVITKYTIGVKQHARRKTEATLIRGFVRRLNDIADKLDTVQ